MSKGIISYDFGHLEGGQDTSANGIVYEYKEVRRYGQVVVDILNRNGYTMVNCTPPNGTKSLSSSLSYRTNKANASGSMLHLCFHANCFNGKAHGSEIEVASDNSAKIAQVVLNEICKLGFTNRGVKRPNLYVTRHTTMKCMLLEPFFIDNRDDVNKYNANSLGTAIAKGILKALGQSTSNISVNHTKTTISNIDTNKKLWQICVNGDVVKRLQHELNVQFHAGIKEDGWFGDGTLSKCITVHRNAHGNISKIIQERLIAKGAKGIVANGHFQDGTYAQLRLFQKNHDLSVDGICGKNTWKELFKK